MSDIWNSHCAGSSHFLSILHQGEYKNVRITKGISTPEGLKSKMALYISTTREKFVDLNFTEKKIGFWQV